jgi:hypothetical protein
METSGFRQRLKKSCPVIAADVVGEGIAERMQHSPPVGDVVLRRKEISLIQVAATATVDEIVITVVATCRRRAVVIDGQLPTRINLSHTAVAAALAVPLPHLFVLGMRHGR